MVVEFLHNGKYFTFSIQDTLPHPQNRSGSLIDRGPRFQRMKVKGSFKSATLSDLYVVSALTGL